MLRNILMKQYSRVPTDIEKKSILETNEFISQSLSPDGVLINPELTQYCTCPICKKDSDIEIAKIKGFQWLFCPSCKLSYVSNLLKKDFHKSDIFSLTIKSMDSCQNIDEQLLTDPIKVQALETLEYIKNIFPEFKSICDIGCGNGGFLEILKSKQIPVMGLDINPQAIETVNSKGIKAINIGDVQLSDFKDMEKPILFTMRQVIEHIRDVENLINKISSFSNSSFALLIETPNLESACAKKLNYKHRHFIGWAHIQVFSTHTFKVLANKVKMRIENIYTYGSKKGVKSFLATKYLPWTFDPFSQEAINKWQETSTNYKKINSKGKINILYVIKKFVKSIIDIMDNAIGLFFPKSDEYIRCILIKDKK